MNELDEKLEAVYDKMDRQKEKIVNEIDKSEARSRTYSLELFTRLKELIDSGNTARSEQVDTELDRLQNCGNDCVKRCTAHKETLEVRLKSLEKWRDLNWQRTIIYAATAVVAAIKMFEWLQGALR